MNTVRMLVVVLAVACGFAGAVYAGHCGYSYAQPIYRPAYKQSYYPQTYSYSYAQQYSYVAPIVAVKEYKDVVLVPLVQKAVVAPEYYFSAKDHYKDAILLELLQQQRALLQQMQGPGNGYQPPAGALPQTRPNGNGNGLNAKGPLPIQASGRIAQIVQGACVRCHGGEQGTKGDLSLVNLDAVPMKTRILCYQQVKVGAMPQKANPLSDADCNEFLNWALEAPR